MGKLFTGEPSKRLAHRLLRTVTALLEGFLLPYATLLTHLNAREAAHRQEQVGGRVLQKNFNPGLYKGSSYILFDPELYRGSL